MILEIINFRNFTGDHPYVRLDIPNKGITLLNGISGAGKTTVLRAIRWCLYGGIAHGEKYEVRIKYKSISIIRKSKPSSLEVKKDGEVYNGDIATQVITDYFGPEEIFDLCCNMKQGDIPCPLLSSVGKDRIRYLSRLAFQDEQDPIIIIEAIGEKLREVRSEFNKLSQQYDIHQALLKNYEEEVELEEEDFTISKEDIEEKIKNIQTKIEEVVSKNLEREKKLTTIANNRKLLKSLEKTIKDEEIKLVKCATQLEEITSSPADYEILNKEKVKLEEEIHQQSQKINELTKELKIVEDIEKYRKMIELQDKVVKILSIEKESIPVYKDRDYYQLESQINEYNTNNDLATKYGVNYEKGAISTQIRKLKEYKTYLSSKTNYSNYELTKTELERFLKNAIKKDLSEEQLKLRDMKRSLELVECPHCQGLVRISGSDLLPSDSSFKKVSKDQIKEQEQLIKDIQKQNTKKYELESEINGHIKRGDDQFVPNEEFEQWFTKGLTEKEIDRKITSLTKIRFHDKPLYTIAQADLLLSYNKSIVANKFTSEDLDANHRDRQSIINELDIIEKSIKSKNMELSTVLKKIKDFAEEGNNIKSLMNKKIAIDAVISNTKKQIEKVQNDYQSLNSAQDEDNKDYDALKKKLEEKIDNLKLKLKKIDRAKEITSRRNDLMKEKLALKKKKKSFKSLNKLYDNAIHQHKEQLQSVINSINYCISNGIDKVFNYPLVIALELVSPEEIDEKKRYKHKIEFKIIKDGKTYRKNPEDIFSGGEMKRMILLIVIALNTLYKSKILLLDEMFSSLDTEMREDCLQVIRHYLGDRMIISAEHYAEKGDYDHTLDITPLWLAGEE